MTSTATSTAKTKRECSHAATLGCGGDGGWAGRKRPAFVLIIVLIVVAMLSFAAYTFAELMMTNYEGALQGGDQLQAQMLVESGVDYTRQFLVQLPEARNDGGGIYNNPMIFQNIICIGDATTPHQGSFTVVSPAFAVDGSLEGVRYGLEDESGRLNMNILLWADSLQEGAGRNLLMALPGMSEDVADSILDWLDEDDEIREFGAELEYYSQLSPPYEPKNGMLDTIAELLRVKGVSPQLLFGIDINRNGRVDPHETSGFVGQSLDAQTLMSGVTNEDGSTTSLERGWSAFLTIYSAEANLNAEGMPRIDINGDDLETLYADLEERFNAQWATFIVGFRQSGAYTGNDAGDVSAGGLDLSQEGGNKFTQILDLIGAKVRANLDGDQVVLAPVFPEGPGAMALYLPALMDNCTIANAATIPGRININQASRDVLLGIPTMSPEIVDTIIQERDVSGTESTDENRRHETWLMTEAIVTLDEMKLLMPFICGRGDVYRAQVVGYFQNGGVSSRTEVVIDATTEQPQVLLWKDISHLGRGYQLDQLGVSYAAAAE